MTWTHHTKPLKPKANHFSKLVFCKTPSLFVRFSFTEHWKEKKEKKKKNRGERNRESGVLSSMQTSSRPKKISSFTLRNLLNYHLASSLSHPTTNFSPILSFFIHGRIERGSSARISQKKWVFRGRVGSQKGCGRKIRIGFFWFWEILLPHGPSSSSGQNSVHFPEIGLSCRRRRPF